jgi:cell division septal protein FtsQ
MATLAGDLARERKPPRFARRPFVGPGTSALAVKKGRGPRVLRVRHVVLLLVLQAAIFAGVRQAYLFLITWDELTIRKVTIVCAKPGLRQTLESFYAASRLGNILLCDLEAVRAQVRRLAWVRDASVQKDFPSGLRIVLVERTPFALLERDGLALADEDGHVLEKVTGLDEYALPVVTDETAFASGFFEKWEAARRCLQSLPPAEKDRLLGIRTNDYGTLELAFRNDPVKVIVSASSPAAGLAAFRARRAEWERRFGPLAAADMSYDGRTYLRPAPPAPDDAPAQPAKGV